MHLRPRAPIGSSPRYGRRWNRSSMRQRRPRAPISRMKLERPSSRPQRERRVIQSWNFPLYSINSSVPNPGMKNPPLPIISDRPPRRLVEVARTKSKPSQNAPAGNIGNRDKPARSTGSTR